MVEVPENDKNENAVCLPHHPVVKMDRETTKVRVVFDASCKGKNGISLNDDLMIGPKLQPDLRHLVMKWRMYPICLVSDIVKMYRQVKVTEEDADFQRILWRENSNEVLKEYKLLRVTFGTACAPYLAVKALQQVAIDHGKDYPMASERVLKDFYMDDLMTGCMTVDEGVQVYKEMNELLGKAGFELQKWTSNSNQLIKAMKLENNEKEIEDELKIKHDEIIKILGLTWNRNSDDFQYSVKLPPMKKLATKRTIISDISRLYDPLGWAAPSIILAKVMIQKLWLTGLGWDEDVPCKLLQEWSTYREELSELTKVHIPRWLGIVNKNSEIELHGFCDASKMAYAAVVYARIVDKDDNITVSLVTAKTRVAPIKQVSIPRLELCGAVMLTRLLVEVSQVMNIAKDNIHAWTDSTVVLAWLNNHPSKWQTFVANRVSEILTTLESNQWSHVSSKHNPADCASRGVKPCDLKNTEIWFHGPEFLKQKFIKYEKPRELVTNLEEVKVHHITTDLKIWDRFSSLTKLVRVMAYCRRFLTNMRKPEEERRRTNYLTGQEIHEALNICVKQCQQENFEQDYKNLLNGIPVSKKSTLKTLNPFLDENGLMRVGGRLENSQLAFNKKTPRFDT
ncbi:uncharacterized protein [Choristoneura fumiferana]|uniref:uncharacterized protein n=1 Tax=Choristoneura fumiferana TaxID=7141 RepID=UPI003D15B444